VAAQKMQDGVEFVAAGFVVEDERHTALVVAFPG